MRYLSSVFTSILFTVWVFALQCRALSLIPPPSTAHAGDPTSIFFDITWQTSPDDPPFFALKMRSPDDSDPVFYALVPNISSYTANSATVNMSQALDGRPYFLQATDIAGVPPGEPYYAGNVLANSTDFALFSPASTETDSESDTSSSSSTSSIPIATTTISSVTANAASPTIVFVTTGISLGPVTATESTTQAASEFHSGARTQMGIIAGIIIGVLLLLAILIASLILCHRRRRQRRNRLLMARAFIVEPSEPEYHYHYAPSSSGGDRTSIGASTIYQSDTKSSPFDLLSRLEIPIPPSARTASWNAATSTTPISGLDGDLVRRQLDEMAARIRQLEAERDNALSAVSPPDYVSLSGDTMSRDTIREKHG
ncbi:hypothetical protein C8J56DRAFT_1038671 [Mycena floridula]|nr:hypothetical protein C8J56DRAFT_1038671 [Mycena floridula]